MSSRALPEWFETRKKPWLERLGKLTPFPFDQPADSKDFLACHHNDYLRLSSHPEVVAARNEATQRTGSGAMASVAYGGDHGYHSEFRRLIAESARARDADSVVLTTCGWTANVGLLEAVADPDVPVYIDINAHASLWDGARMANARLVPIKHNDPASIKRFVKVFGPGVIVIDSFYSTHGSVAPLEGYVEVAEETGCLLILDEAHSFGLIGEDGGGLAVERGVAEHIPLRTVSIAKGLGGHGGFIIADAETAKFLTFRLRSVIFSSSPTPSTSAGNAKALEILRREPERARTMHERAEQLRRILNENGVDTGPSRCQIVSLMFKGEDSVCTLYGKLKERGILFSVFLAPAVPENTGLARFSIYHGLREKDIDYIAENILDVLRSIGAQSEFPKNLRLT